MKYLVVICMFACFFMTSCMIQTGWDYFVQGKINNYQVIKCSPNSLFSLSNIDLKSATKPFNVLLACTHPLITEFADDLN